MTRQKTSAISADRKRALRLAGALIGLAVVLGACKHTGDEVAAASVPDDYRLRHPIAVQEADRSIIVFVGRGRGGISAPQRDDVMGMATKSGNENSLIFVLLGLSMEYEWNCGATRAPMSKIDCAWS